MNGCFNFLLIFESAHLTKSCVKLLQEPRFDDGGMEVISLLLGETPGDKVEIIISKENPSLPAKISELNIAACYNPTGILFSIPECIKIVTVTNFDNNLHDTEKKKTTTKKKKKKTTDLSKL